MSKHKHYDCIVAWANGEQIQVCIDGVTAWKDLQYAPRWIDEYEYRVKPKEKSPGQKACEAYYKAWGGWEGNWDISSLESRALWEAAAQAVLAP